MSANRLLSNEPLFGFDSRGEQVGVQLVAGKFEPTFRQNTDDMG